MSEVFYQKLNQSTRKVKNTDYISDTSIFMEQSLNKHRHLNNLLIIGAGNLNDVSLDFFRQYFKRIYLTDIDVESIKRHLKNIEDNHIVIKQLDYIGTVDTAFYQHFDLLLSMKTIDEMTQFIGYKLKKLFNHRFSQFINQSFDCIYISPIYTQLLYREFEYEILNLKSHGLEHPFVDALLSLVLQEMIKIIDHFNIEVVSLLNDLGVVYLSTDILSITDNPFSKAVVKAIDHQDKMDNLYHQYHQKYGYGLGDYGLFSISQVLHLSREKWMIWNQDETHQHAVKFCELYKEEPFN